MKAIAAADADTPGSPATRSVPPASPGSPPSFAPTDGGETWKRTSFGDALLADVAFADARHGVLVALDRIWSTRDGGRTWRLRKQLPHDRADRAWPPATPGTPGSPAGAPRTARRSCCATRDGGATWRRLRIDVPAPKPGALQTRQIACAGESRLWVTCDAGVLATADGGKTWELQKVAAGAAAGHRGRRRAARAGDDAAVRPILATADGGATWPAFGEDGFLDAAARLHRRRQGRGRRRSRTAARALRPARRTPPAASDRIAAMATPLGSTHASRRKALVADVLLFSVAIFWGSNFVFIKDVVERTTELAAGSIVAGTMLYLVLRYVVATGIFAVAQPQQLARLVARRLGARRSARRLLPDRPHPPDHRPAAHLARRQRLHHRDERRHGPLPLLVRRAPLARPLADHRRDHRHHRPRRAQPAGRLHAQVGRRHHAARARCSTRCTS